LQLEQIYCGQYINLSFFAPGKTVLQTFSLCKNYKTFLCLNFLGDEDGTDQDTLEFQLKVKCTWNPNAPKDSTNLDDLYKDHKSKCTCYVSIIVL
jgi:hypothetical protein